MADGILLCEPLASPTLYLCAGLVLADFNKHFLGSMYQSQHDTNISAQAVTSAALVAARALHEIASGGSKASELKASLQLYHLFYL